MKEVKCLDHGFVRLIDVMGNDSAIVQAARVSYGEGTKTTSKDRALIRYLLRHRHTSPFEMVEFKFHCKMPIFVARQWIRHRTASVNEVSGRYSILPEEKYLPDPKDICFQNTDNRQGRSPDHVPDDVTNTALRTIKEVLDHSGKAYGQLLENNIAREISRICLPLSQYTEWYWKIDLHNLLNFLKLRLDRHSQKEIRVYAEAIRDLISPVIPLTWEAFKDFELTAYHLSGPEMNLIRDLIKKGNQKLPDEYPGITEREMKDLKRTFENDE